MRANIRVDILYDINDFFKYTEKITGSHLRNRFVMLSGAKNLVIRNRLVLISTMKVVWVAW